MDYNHHIFQFEPNSKYTNIGVHLVRCFESLKEHFFKNPKFCFAATTPHSFFHKQTLILNLKQPFSNSLYKRTYSSLQTRPIWCLSITVKIKHRAISFNFSQKPKYQIKITIHEMHKHTHIEMNRIPNL